MSKAMGTPTIDGELMAFRPGDLAEKIDAAARRNECTKSEVLRRALESYFNVEPVAPYGIYLGAAAYFLAVADAALKLGLFSEGAGDDLVKAVRRSQREVQNKLEMLFRRLYPGEMTPSEFRSWVIREDRRRPGGLTDHERVGPEHIEKWTAAVESYGNFPDLRQARRVLLRLGARSGSVDDDLLAYRPEKYRTGKKKSVASK
jgi:hypothetical protein